jgi:hypothetical protein
MKLTLDPTTDSLVAHVPLNMKRLGGRSRVMVIPPVSTEGQKQVEGDPLDHKALKAVATALSWQAELEVGKYNSHRELAEAKGFHHSYVWRVLRLIYLDPSIIKALLQGQQPSGFSITQVMTGLPLSWEEQRKVFGFD